MQLAPRLIDVTVPEDPVGLVLVLHGGASRRARAMVSPAQLSVLRMIPIAARIARLGQDRLAVFRVLNTRRGWDTQHTPAQDCAWALDRVAERFGERLPTCLVGHSLGGRAALVSASRPEVRSVAALAPWVYPTDVPRGLHGERILIIHGTADRIALPDRSEALAQELSAAADVAYISVRGGKHAMLSRHAAFDRLAADWATLTLLGESRTESIARIEAGERWLEV